MWVAYELSEYGLDADPSEIAAAIRRVLKRAEVWTPASVVQRDQARSVQRLFDGYVFVRHTFECQQYARLTDTRYIVKILLAGPRTKRTLALIADAEIERLRDQSRVAAEAGGAEDLRPIGVGDIVEVLDGPLKKVPVTVTDIIGDDVTVHLQLRSLARLLTVPRGLLRLIKRGEPTVTEQMTEVTEPVPEPVTEHVTEPVTEPATEPAESGRRYRLHQANFCTAIAGSGLTQDAIAGAIGLSRRQLFAIRSGGATVDAAALGRLAETLFVGVGWLLGESEPE